MDRPQLLLVLATVLLNVALGASYAVVGLDMADFGRVPRALWWYFVGTAALAFLSMWAFVGVIASKRAVPATSIYAVLASLTVYYALQMAFLPLARSAVQGRTSRWAVRALLLACVPPVAIIAGTGVELKDPWLASLGGVASLHVLFNDAVVYGFLF